VNKPFHDRPERHKHKISETLIETARDGAHPVLSQTSIAMAAFDLDAELAAGQETAKRRVERERENAAVSLAAALETSAKLPSAKAVGQLRRAMKTMDDGPAGAGKAARLCMKVVEAEPDFALGHHAMALALERLGRLSTALTFYERAWKLDPSDPEVYFNLGMLAWKLDMLEAAEKFLRLHMNMKPQSKSGLTNLAGLLRDTQKYADATELLRAAIYADAEDADLWNALGTTLLESGDPHQALTFYQEALRLNPDYARAHYNMAFALDLLGETKPAIEHFRTALDLNPAPADRVNMEHGMSHALLADGLLEEGWRLYENRLSPLYKSCVHFAVQTPYWSGEDPGAIRGKRLLLVGEQGLGDEIMHASALRDAFDAVGPDGAVALVCEGRLVELFARSFDQLEHVGRHATIFREGKQIRSVLDAETVFKPDLWAPLGSLQRAFRSSIDQFPALDAYLKPREETLARLKAQVDALPPGLRVGFTWKSKLMTGHRVKYFSPFEMWRPVLETPGCTFVSLQYGEVDEELARCARDYGVTIHQIDGLDLMNDLEGVGALGSLLDVSIGQHNASLALTAACGGEIYLLASTRRQWTNFGTDRHLWSPNATVFAPETFRDWAKPIGRIAGALSERAGKASRGAA
jgi:tetratricopeptide (TPR) repeat protein